MTSNTWRRRTVPRAFVSTLGSRVRVAQATSEPEEVATRYMLLIYSNEAGWSALDQQSIEEMGRTHRSIQKELKVSGELIDHRELAFEEARWFGRRTGFLSLRRAHS